MREITKSFLILASGKLFLSLIKFSIGLLTARYFGADGKGLYVTVSRSAQLVALLQSLGLGDSLIWAHGKDKKSKEELFYISLVWIIFAISLFILLIMSGLLLDFFILLNWSFYLDYINEINLAIIGLIIHGFFLKFFQAVKDFGYYNIFSLSNVAFQLITLLSAIIFFRADLDTAILLVCYSLFASSIIEFFILCIRIKRP